MRADHLEFRKQFHDPRHAGGFAPFVSEISGMHKQRKTALDRFVNTKRLGIVYIELLKIRVQFNAS